MADEKMPSGSAMDGLTLNCLNTIILLLLRSFLCYK
jgi:hypothetical protein